MSVEGIGQQTMDQMAVALKKPWQKHGKMSLFNECIEILREAKLAWDVKYIDTSAILCHPQTSGGADA